MTAHTEFRKGSTLFIHLKGGTLATIEKAIYAERQRCAKIAEEWKCSVSGGIYTDVEVDEICATIGPNISQAILADKEES